MQLDCTVDTVGDVITSPVPTGHTASLTLLSIGMFPSTILCDTCMYIHHNMYTHVHVIYYNYCTHMYFYFTGHFIGSVIILLCTCTCT